jgi:hypothetical protein
MVPAGQIDQRGLDDFLGVSAFGFIWLLPVQPVGKFLVEILTTPDLDPMSTLVYCSLLNAIPYSHSGVSADTAIPYLLTRLKSVKEMFDVEKLSKEEAFFEAIEKSKFAVFDPFAWSQRKMTSGDDEFRSDLL